MKTPYPSRYERLLPGSGFFPVSLGFKGMALVSLAVFLFESCAPGASSDDAKDTSDVLVMVGDSALRLPEVEARIPGGLSEEDSTEMFDAMVMAWVERQLLDGLARENIDDMDRIDMLAEKYRSRLIVDAYRMKMREKGLDKVSDKQVEEYYRANASEMKLDAPVVKGLFLKIKADSPDADRLRSSIFSANPKDLDRLEKYQIADGVQYTFFQDRWVDWYQIADRIPFRFDDPDRFVADNRNFETEYQGYRYLLHIEAFLPSGATMPKDYAVPLIRQMLEEEASESYERNLISSLCRKAGKEGKLRSIGYHKPLY